MEVVVPVVDHTTQDYNPALYIAGCPLSCEVCRGSGTTCSGKMKTCEAGKDACVVIVGESSTSTCVRLRQALGEPLVRRRWAGRAEGKTISRWMKESELRGAIETIIVRDF